jgi:hypothetical protein
MANEQKQKVEKKKTGLIVAWSGIGILVLGYIFLAKGSITLAPILIIGSFFVMAAGIFMGWD